MGRKAAKGKTLASTSAAASASLSASTSPTNQVHGSSDSSVSVSVSASTTAGTASLSSFPPLVSSSSSSSQRVPAWWRGYSEGRLRMEIVALILKLKNSDHRGYALSKLAKMGAFPDLALYLWHSFGTIAILIQEVVSIYPMMSRSPLTAEQSTRACDVLALFQCVASHPIAKKYLIKAHIPEYLFPFLSKTGDFRDFEHIRIATLGVIGALVKEGIFFGIGLSFVAYIAQVPENDVIIFLLSLEIMPICLCAMESGTEMSRTWSDIMGEFLLSTLRQILSLWQAVHRLFQLFHLLALLTVHTPIFVATFILQGLLQEDVGLHYINHVPVRLSAVLQALGNVIAALSEKPSVPLLKQAVKCYLHLLKDQRTLKELKRFFPKRLCDGTFNYCVRDDQTLRKCLQQLLDIVQGS